MLASLTADAAPMVQHPDVQQCQVVELKALRTYLLKARSQHLEHEYRMTARLENLISNGLPTSG